MRTKFIVVTGGVLSGLGKGITTASIGRLLRDNYRVVPIKCDGYLNTDPGTLNPLEHGEVFVLDDGAEVDMDFGHYERFIDITARAEWNITMGKVFQRILKAERKGDFLGHTVQYIPHVVDLIKGWIVNVAKQEKADVVLVEIGGTVGDMENELFIESVRQLAQEYTEGDFLFNHLTYIPTISTVGEQKSKPTQQSVKLLNERGIFPDVIIGRCAENLTEKIKERIALFCNVDKRAVISGKDIKPIYANPIMYYQEGYVDILRDKLGLIAKPNLNEWRKIVNRIENPRKRVQIAIAGKYTALRDSYASLVEALVHAGASIGVGVDINWVETTGLEKKMELESLFKGSSGLIVPGGFGHRGAEGKISSIKFAREKRLPFLGLCYGLQLAIVEVARNLCGLEGANSREFAAEGTEIKHPVVSLLEEQRDVKQKGGSMRLGAQDVILLPGTKLYRIYNKKEVIRERFRHRYEINPSYVKRLEKGGVKFSARSKQGIVQAFELKDHPFFIGVQYHPEFLSRPEKPSPLFVEFLKEAVKWGR